MRHVEPEVLALLALGEEVAKAEELAHLQACAECGTELTNLKHAARVGRSALGAGELIAPPARVWDRISEELELEGSVRPPVAQGDPALEPEREERGEAPVIPLRRPRRSLPILAAAAAAVLLVAGGATAWQLLRPQEPEVLAAADLEAFPAWPGAEGSARLEETADGARVVRVSLDAPGGSDGYREVWLITSDATRLVSLGVLEGREGTFAVPEGIDTAAYDLVDISEEPLDGDPAHSGDSIVRGQLES